MMVDDAHASGVFGQNGRGTVDHSTMHGRVDVQVGTLVEGRRARWAATSPGRALIEFLYHRARPFLFSHVASARGRRVVHRRARHPRAGAARSSSGSGRTRASSRPASRRSDSTPALSESPITPVIAGEGAEGDDAVRSALPGGRVRPGHRLPDGRRATRRASARSSPPPIRREELQFALDTFAKVGTRAGTDLADLGLEA